MNFNHSTRLMGIALMAVALMSVTSVTQNVFAAEGMSLTATADGQNISVSGETASSTLGPVTLIVTAPNGNLITIDQLEPDANGIFGTNITIGGQLWLQDGMYTIAAQQGESSLYSIKLSIEVNGGAATETSTGDSSLTSEAAEAAESEAEAEAEESGLSITANAINGSDTIGITGQTSKTNEDVTLTVTSPNGNIVSIDQLSPGSDGSFATDIVIGGQLWSQDGIYTVTAQQGNVAAYKDTVEVDVLDGLVVPEFGTIAAMILAVAIISIIAISSKSRLSIMPRY
jgi:predicted secreted protein with PEFG-CTERM motif